MIVKTLREHSNEFGGKFKKSVGDTYDVDADTAKSLITAGYVEKSDGSEGRGTGGSGAGSKRAS